MATALGMPIRNRGQQYPRYDGQWVNLSGLYLRFVAHEIGHWVAASEWELELVDYGLLSMETDTNMQREAVADTVARKVTRAVDAVEYEGVPTVWDTPQWEFIRTVHRPNT